jgi:hypothetical protein
MPVPENRIDRARSRPRGRPLEKHAFLRGLLAVDLRAHWSETPAMTAPRLARSLRRARLGERLAALAVATTLVVSASPASAHLGPANAQEIERLYLEGQDLYGKKDFKGAAEAWTRLLNLMPESGTNQATRENVLINILAAHLDAYRRMRNEDGTRPIEHLREGKKTLDQYYADFKQIHGDRTAVSAAVQEKGDELEQELAKAEDELAAAAAKTETVSDTGGNPPIVTTTTTNPPIVDGPLQPERDGKGLIITGAVVGGVGLVTLITMVAIGGAGGRTAERDYDEARDRGDTQGMQDAEANGARANSIAIAGGVVGGVLLATGTALLVVGLVKRKESNRGNARAAVSPVAGRGFGGVAISGRF